MFFRRRSRYSTYFYTPIVPRSRLLHQMPEPLFFIVFCIRKKQFTLSSQKLCTKKDFLGDIPTGLCVILERGTTLIVGGDLPDAPFVGRGYRTFCVILRSATKRDEESPTAQEAPWGTSLWHIAGSLYKVTLCKDQCEHSFPDALCCASGDPSTFFVESLRMTQGREMSPTVCALFHCWSWILLIRHSLRRDTFPHKGRLIASQDLQRTECMIKNLKR